MNHIIISNPNGDCLSSLGSILNNSQNHKNIYSVETDWSFRLHAKEARNLMNHIIISNPNGDCLSSLESMLNNSQNLKNIYSVKTISSFRLHKKEI